VCGVLYNNKNNSLKALARLMAAALAGAAQIWRWCFKTCRMNCFCSSSFAELDRHCALRNHLQLLLSGRYLDSVCRTTVPGCPTRSGHAPGIAHQALRFLKTGVMK